MAAVDTEIREVLLVRQRGESKRAHQARADRIRNKLTDALRTIIVDGYKVDGCASLPDDALNSAWLPSIVRG